MVKNKRGGNRAKKQKNSSVDNSRRQLHVKDNSVDSCELYGKVVSRLVGSPARILVNCEDGVERNCVIRGKFHKRIWINPGDYIIIIYNRGSSDNSGEVAHKYFPHEVPQLISKGEIDDNKFKDNQYGDDDMGITFAKEDDIKKTEDNWFDIAPAKSSNKTFIANMDNDDDDDDEFDFDDI